MAAGLPLMESVLTPLAKCVLLPTEASIQRIIFRSHYDNKYFQMKNWMIL